MMAVRILQKIGGVEYGLLFADFFSFSICFCYTVLLVFYGISSLKQGK